MTDPRLTGDSGFNVWNIEELCGLVTDVAERVRVGMDEEAFAGWLSRLEPGVEASATERRAGMLGSACCCGCVSMDGSQQCIDNPLQPHPIFPALRLCSGSDQEPGCLEKYMSPEPWLVDEDGYERSCAICVRHPHD